MNPRLLAKVRAMSGGTPTPAASSSDLREGRQATVGQCEKVPADHRPGKGGSTASTPCTVRPALRARGLSRREEALAWMAQSFGADWRAHVHAKHELVVAQPLVYCNSCGRFASGRRHMRGILEVCHGKAEENTTYFAYRRYMRDGRHPYKDERISSDQVPIPRDAAALGAGTTPAAPLRKARRCA